jgi:hypothetical protein
VTRVGRYPFAKGPLVGYSYSVARALVDSPELDQDERHALVDRKRKVAEPMAPFAHSLLLSAEALDSMPTPHPAIAGVPLTNVVTGQLYSNPKRKMHPTNAVVFDDIYYGYLVMKTFSNRSLALVNARLSEVDKTKPLEERLDTQGGWARIYHKLKTSVRFGWVNKTRTLNALKQHVRSKYACVRRQRLFIFSVWQVRGLHVTSALDAVPSRLAPLSHANLTTCCERWIYCEASAAPRLRRGRRQRQKEN